MPDDRQNVEGRPDWDTRPDTDDRPLVPRRFLPSDRSDAERAGLGRQRVPAEAERQEDTAAQRLPDEDRRPARREFVAADLERIINELQGGVQSRHWELVESALHRLRSGSHSTILALHESTADEGAMRQAREDAEPERRAQIEREEANRVAQEHYNVAAPAALDNRDRYGTAQVDNAAREAFVTQRNAERMAFDCMSDAERREWDGLDADERRDALKNKRFPSLANVDVSEEAISRQAARRPARSSTLIGDEI